MTKMVSRNRFLATAVLSLMLAALLAACGDPTATTAPATTAAVATTSGVMPTSAAGAAGKKLEIFSWWTSGGEADGLNAMYGVFKKMYPNTEIVNATVTGGAGSNAKTVLVTRMQGGQPPDSFQVHAGQELIGTWVVANKMEPITSIFKEQGWDKVMPKLLLDQITYNGEIYSVPVNIHRSNMLWYNKKVFDSNGLKPPKTLDEFYSVAETLKAKGITPLSVGGKDKFETPHLFESVLLATYGPDDYPKIFAKGSKLTEDARMDKAIQTLEKMLGYANADRSSLSWSDAAQKVLDGTAAMTIMGDWAEGYFISKGAKPNVEFGYAAAPGTDGVFMWLSDSFGLPKGAPNRDSALAWLKLCGSKEGQDAFNPKKGSIPARTDADKSLYDEYLKWSIEQFGSTKLAPSVVHGAAANEAYSAAYGNALNVFSADKDTKSLSKALKDAAKELG
jgi:glucose/mannose transport system substrate-binding protein